jgi:hypothetical protein
VFPPGVREIKQNPDGRIVTGTGSEAIGMAELTKEVGAKSIENASRFLEKLKGVEVER